MWWSIFLQQHSLTAPTTFSRRVVGCDTVPKCSKHLELSTSQRLRKRVIDAPNVFRPVACSTDLARKVENQVTSCLMGLKAYWKPLRTTALLWLTALTQLQVSLTLPWRVSSSAIELSWSQSNTRRGCGCSPTGNSYRNDVGSPTQLGIVEIANWTVQE